MEGVTSTLVLAIFGSILGMFYFGFNTGVINAPQNSIEAFIVESHKSHYDIVITDSTLDILFTLITSAFVVGGMAGALVGGSIADKLGRKRGLILSALMGLIGGIITAISEPAVSWEVLLVGRLIVGLTAGLNTVVAPLYLAEIAPVSQRGGIGVLNQLAVTLGIFISQIMGLSEILGNDSGWPWLLAISALPPLVQLIILFMCPRSPRYLFISLEKEAEARKELYRLRRNDDDVEEEIKEMLAEKQAEKEPDLSILDLLRSKELLVALLIGVVMHLSQQLSGMVAIFYYAVTFFKNAGIEENDAKYANLGVGAIMVTMTLVTVPLMDRLGRRVLHLTGLGGMCLMSVMIVVAANIDSDGAKIFLIVATLGFVVFFAVGPGSIPWMICGELFTQGPRPAATSVCVAVNWSANLLVSLLFPTVLLKSLDSFSFLPFAILLAIFFAFVFLFLPETKGKQVSETTALLKEKGWKAGRAK